MIRVEKKNKMPKRIRKKNKLKNENTGDLDLADQITVDKLKKLEKLYVNNAKLIFIL